MTPRAASVRAPHHRLVVACDEATAEALRRGPDAG